MTKDNLLKLAEQLEAKAEYWRTKTDDPYGIATSVYVTLAEVAEAVKAAADYEACS